MTSLEQPKLGNAGKKVAYVERPRSQTASPVKASAGAAGSTDVQVEMKSMLQDLMARMNSLEAGMKRIELSSKSISTPAASYRGERPSPAGSHRGERPSQVL